MEVNSLRLVPQSLLRQCSAAEMIGKLFRRNGGNLQEKRARVVVLNRTCLVICSESRNFVKQNQWMTRCILLYYDICSRTIT